MKKLNFCLSVLLFFLLNVSFAQKEKLATTDDNERVVLYPDGTWTKLGEPKPKGVKTTNNNASTKYSGCYIKTGLMTFLLSDPKIFATELTELPEHKQYQVLDRKEVLHARKKIYFFLIKDDDLDLEGWVKAGIGLDFTHPNCLN